MARTVLSDDGGDDNSANSLAADIRAGQPVRFDDELLPSFVEDSVEARAAGIDLGPAQSGYVTLLEASATLACSPAMVLEFVARGWLESINRNHPLLISTASVVALRSARASAGEFAVSLVREHLDDPDMLWVRNEARAIIDRRDAGVADERR